MRHRPEGEEDFPLRRERRVEDIAETDDAPAPLRPVHGLVPHHGEFAEPAGHLVQGREGERPELCAKWRQRLRRAVARTRGPTGRMLREDQRRRGDRPLGFGNLQELRTGGGAFEDPADHGHAFRCGRLVQIDGEIGGGVVVEGADAPGSHAISSTSPARILAPVTDNGPARQAAHAVTGAGSREPGAGV